MRNLSNPARRFMKYLVQNQNPKTLKSGCAVVGVFNPRKLTAAGEAFDRLSNGLIDRALASGDLDGKPGQTLLLHLPDASCSRVLLVGLGREAEFDESAYRKASAAAIRALRNTGAADVHSYLTHLPLNNRDLAWKVRQAALIAQDELYRFDQWRGDKAKEELPRPKLTRLSFDAPKPGELGKAEQALEEALAIGQGVAFTKDLGNQPPNICTPTFLGEQAKQLARQHKSIRTKVLERAELEKLGMGSFLSVAQGSRQPPKLIVLEYWNGPKKDKPVALVGKGVTFDTGGISIKPSDKMDEMKFDMCGGASVLGAFKAVAELKLPINLVGVVPACENMPGGQAVKPGDIVKSMSGITIEILNTDAEGRLILCDALTYVEKNYAPAYCVDIATLTGACVVALGTITSGLFSNTETLARALLDAAEESGDRTWRLPLWEEYQPMLKSEHADVANISGGREAGAITAASFLHRFTRKMKWAHLDVAGTAWKGKRATGRPVPLLMHYLMDCAKSQNAETADRRRG
jgi:leucyl aminopeptidase